jgi:hypothetical protein
VNDHGAIQWNIFLSIMWDAPSLIENYTAGPEDDLIATHVYNAPGTYELRFNLTHGNGVYNCYFDDDNCQIPYYAVITNDGCSIIDAFNYTIGAEANTNATSASRQSSLSYFAWLAFAVRVGMSALDIVA